MLIVSPISFQLFVFGPDLSQAQGQPYREPFVTLAAHSLSCAIFQRLSPSLTHLWTLS